MSAERSKPAAKSSAAFRRDRRTRAIVSAWRRLIGANPSGRTLIACSGGADSVALLLALATATDRLVVGHVVHDLRSTEESNADGDFVRSLAEMLGLPFVESRVNVTSRAREVGEAANLESRARQLRYAALQRLARENGCSLVAVAHHADDQLETMLMALMRGSGGRGLAGMAVRRILAAATSEDHGGTVQLIRPMLAAGVAGCGLTRQDSRELCEMAGVQWRDDATNLDTRLLRAAVRHEVVPLLKKLRPKAAQKAAVAAVAIGEGARSIERAAARLMVSAEVASDGRSLLWKRGILRKRPEGVLFALLRRSHRKLVGPVGLDRLTRRAMSSVVRAVTDRSTEERTIELSALRVRVDSRHVCIERRKA